MEISILFTRSFNPALNEFKNTRHDTRIRPVALARNRSECLAGCGVAKWLFTAC